MPGANLTKVEAQERAGTVGAPMRYKVWLDLTHGPERFMSQTTIEFASTPGERTFLDLIADEVSGITLNGVALNPTQAVSDNRIALEGLRERNEVQVSAWCRYSHTGEGLHRSVDPSDGRVYLYSQFEVPDARRVYAVFDQPDLKSVFDFSVRAPRSWIVLSTMPVESRRNVDRLCAQGTLERGAVEASTQWEFRTTPIMSSYLTAICAGPYAQWNDSYANEDGRTIAMGMYCRQSLKEALAKDVRGLFDITKKGFAFYAATWGVPYPYAKYDQVYVPEYNAGAMENIGLVTLRDQYVFESKVTDAMAERRVITVLHELAHMWFGDYVTMRWWNDLWLNESFAEFTSTLATAEISRWSDAWATFCSGEKSWALNQDQLSTTHPIVAPIDDLNDTYVNFDGITYAKGAAVLKQLVAYVGRERFFAGIHRYLRKHAYANATLADLLAELEATSGRDLKAWSAQWLERSGINTIEARVEESSDGTISALELVQTAPEEHPVLREHRLAIGFYDLDESTGRVVRVDGLELDVRGGTTAVTQAVGKRRPAFLLINDGDLTYTKLRLDEKSLRFAAEHLHRFEDALARAVIWLSLWDMTRDGQFPAELFIDVSLMALSTERESTTFRYALAQVRTAVWHYVRADRSSAVAVHVAERLWVLAGAAEPGSDAQFQLVSAYLGYGEEGDAGFIENVRGLLDGSVRLEGLEVDNNLRWELIKALAGVNAMDGGAVDAELTRNDTTQNREFALGARACRATAQAKEWAFDQALHHDDLTNMQLEAVCRGFASTPRDDLATPYAERYYDAVDWVWEHRTFHMAEALLEGLYPVHADPDELVRLGQRWLDSHAQADKALRRIIAGNVEFSRRSLMVRARNAAL